MFIKTAKRKSKGKIYQTHYIAEGYRCVKTGKVKHRHLANITKLPEKQILALKESFSGNTQIAKSKLEDLDVIATKQYGNIVVFSKIFRTVFGKHISDEYYDEIQAIVINKIFEAKSKIAIKNWIKKTDLKINLSDKNRMYEALDYLSENQYNIEKNLSKKTKKYNLLLYDITSTYFEGKGAEELCKYGYSRDHRRDKVQVNIGLVTDSKGNPVCVEVFQGNITDKKTLSDKIKTLKERFNIQAVNFIFDRGMKTEANLDNLIEQGYDYITALSHSQLKQKAQENKNIQLSIFDKQNLVEYIVTEEEIQKKYVLCHNPTKKINDKKTRLKLISKTEKRLKEIQNFKRKYTDIQLQDKVSKGINRFKCEKFIDYQIKDNKLIYSINQEALTKAELYDGFYMLVSSNTELSGDKIQAMYKSLQFVERAFDDAKNIIALRPVRHFKASRIKGHIFSCFMAYHLLHVFREKTTELLKKYSLDFLLTELEIINKSYIKIDKLLIEKINNLSPIQKQILKCFKIKNT